MKHSFSRRDFLKTAIASALSLLAGCKPLPEAISTVAQTTPTQTLEPPSTSTPTLTASPVPTTTRQVCRLDEAFFQRRLSLKGETYLANVPDSFDFQEKAERALNALTRCTNPEADYSVYFYGMVNRNPPILTDADIEPNPTSFNGKFSEATLMMRLITGSELNPEVDQTWRRKFLAWLAQSNPALVGPDLGRLLAWMALLYQIEGDACYEILGEKAIQRMLQESVARNGHRFFPGAGGLEPAGEEIIQHSWTLQGIAHFYRASGYPPAEILGKELSSYLKDHAQIFDQNGNFLWRQSREMGMVRHFHSNGNTLLALAEMAALTGDRETVELIGRGYENAKKLGSSLVGFFPEYIPDFPGQFDYVDCETCCVADMVLTALWLTQTGRYDFWDDIDRYVRNQLTENQMVSGDWIDQYTRTLPKSEVPRGAAADRISERVVGSFSGWAAANDYLIDINQPLVSACCTGNAARALFYVWKHMLSYEDGKLKIHLMMNRASRLADVDSHIPYEGKIEIHLKCNCDLEIRLPEWVEPEQASGTIDAQPVELSNFGRYVAFTGLETGQTAMLTFPIAERVEQTEIGERSYSLVIKGNDVVSIDPPGTWHPCYQRAHSRQPSARWVERRRFVASGV